MLYATMTFWLLVMVFVAYGVYQLWTALIKARTVNILLLPGTLVAQLGHIVGLLVTGGTINDTSLIKDNETGEPSTSKESKSQIPVIGPIVVALLPILACGFSIYMVLQTLGQPLMVANLDAPSLSQSLPTSVGAFWQMLRDVITVVEGITATILHSDYGHWQTWVFVYLLICLSVRMAPLPGNQRGAVGAILVLGLISALIGMITQSTADHVYSSWTLLSVVIGVLLSLLVVSLIVRGTVGLVKILTADA